MVQGISDLKNTALFLDFDGTLVEFAPTPDGVKVPETLTPLLKKLRSETNDALAMVTGRSVASLRLHLGDLEVAVAGEHGGQWQLPGMNVQNEGAVDFSAELAIAKQAFGEIEGIEIEEKTGGFAVHYRRASQQGNSVQSTMHNLGKGRDELQVFNGKMLVELRAMGMHKGVAIERFMKTPPFSGRLPVYIGDDTTDEDAFRTVNQLGGVSIKVGEGETVARERLEDIAAVYDWLHALSIRKFQISESL